jgi:hypothetical protein
LTPLAFHRFSILSSPEKLAGNQRRLRFFLIWALRLFDNWLPLLAIADIAGDRWADWVRVAARQFVAKAAYKPSIKVELLMDISFRGTRIHDKRGLSQRIK